MTDQERARLEGLAYLLVACGALALRIFPLMGERGAFGYAIDYDEGVYFSASALLFSGVLPYRDFTFVHPPGVLYFLAPFTALVPDVSQAFALCRHFVAVLGVATAVGCGLLVRRVAGVFGGLAASALYAVFPWAVLVERGPFIEPFFNFAVVGLWGLALEGETRLRDAALWPALVGVGAGVVLATKLTGALWVLAAWGLVCARRRDAKATLLFAAGLATSAGALVLPLALTAPTSFVDQVVGFHFARPPDGDLEHLPRLFTLFGDSQALFAALAFLGLGVGLSSAARRKNPLVVSGALLWLAFAMLFVSAPAYWSQYIAALGPLLAVLGGAGVGWGLARLPTKGAPTFALWVLVAVVAFEGRADVHRAKGLVRNHDERDVRLRASAVEHPDFLTLEPADALVAGALPSTEGAGPIIVDSYATLLMDALSTGARYPTAGQAFSSDASQMRVRARLDTSQAFWSSDRARDSLNDSTRALLRANYIEVEGDVWVRKR